VRLPPRSDDFRHVVLKGVPIWEQSHGGDQSTGAALRGQRCFRMSGERSDNGYWLATTKYECLLAALSSV
jgi:hypothetical protein